MRRLLDLLKLWRWGLAALIGAGIAHIAFAMFMPLAFGGNAFTRLSRSLPMNSFVILPAAGPTTQVLPYQSPDARIAMCRFDLKAGPVLTTAKLPEAGWTLSVYTPQGESIYAFAAQQSTDLALAVMPPGERFVDIVAATQRLETSLTQVHMTTSQGIIVVRAPLKGRTYAAALERDLMTAQCRQMPY